MSIGKLPTGRRPSKQRALYDTVQDRAKRIMGGNYRNRMAGCLRKMGKKELIDCSDWELRRVMGFLSILEKQVGRKR
jgi:hypothetical protein